MPVDHSEIIPVQEIQFFDPYIYIVSVMSRFVANNKNLTNLDGLENLKLKIASN